MEKSQREVTEKIRNSIKLKLRNMNVFVDDELPDYIMILVANKRSKHHMENDLTLFLGNETASFTNWLWDLVNNLKVGSKSHHLKQEISDSKTPEVPVPEGKERGDEDDVLNYDPAEEGEFYQMMEGTEDTNEPASNQLMEANQIKTSASKIIPSSTPDNQATALPHLIAEDVTSNKHVNVKNCEDKKMEPSPLVKKSSSPLKTMQKSAKVYPVQRVEHASAPACELSARPEHAGNVSSVVCVTQRKYGGPAALQANKLLLRAVNDAAKSVLDGKDINEYYKPIPVKDLPTDSTEAYVGDIKTVCKKSNASINIQINKDKKNEAAPSRQVISLKTDPYELSEISEDSVPNSSKVVESTHFSVHEQMPHFIVTLDGVNSPSLKRRHSSEEEIDDNSSFEEPINFNPAKRQKLHERCKYWPSCQNNKCIYHHPTILCKTFPNCKFGDKCFYLHPRCKFDSLCRRVDCPFTHVSKRVVHSKIPPALKNVKTQSVNIICKYYPKCLTKFCPFLHPKLCRYGIQCRAPKCTLSHSLVRNSDIYKWKAQ